MSTPSHVRSQGARWPGRLGGLALCLVARLHAEAGEAPKTPTSWAIPEVRQTPFIMKQGDELRSETVLTIANPGPARNAWVKISVSGKPVALETIGELAVGNSRRTVRVPELVQEREPVTFALLDREDASAQPLAAVTLPQQRIRHWTIYVNHDMHQDIGFTRYQEDLKRTIWPGYLDVVLKAMNDSDGWEDASRARIGLESSFMLYEGALPARSADWVEALKKRLAERRLDYSATYGDVAHENMSAEELARSCYASCRYLPDMLGGGCSTVANMADNNSLCWSVVDAFREAGIRHYTLRLWGAESKWIAPASLFYVESSRSARRLLVYNGGDYTKEPFGLRGKSTEAVRDAVARTLMGLNGDPKYPYDAFLCQFSNGDNGRIDPTVYERVRSYNALGYVYPKMRSALPQDFFEHIEKNFAEAIPVVRGNFENWWNYGVGSTAFESAAHRATQDPLAAGECLATLATVLGAPGRYPYEQVADAWRNMILYSEHTWGPDGSAVNNQWLWKRNTALAAEALAGQVLREGLAAVSSRIPAAGKTLVVYNFQSWARSDLARLSRADLAGAFDLVDNQTGRPVPYEWLSETEGVFVAPDVPALGYKTFAVVPRADRPTFPGGAAAVGNVLENSFFKLVFDATGAITSLLDKTRNNAELVDQEAPHRMNEFVYCRGKTEHRVREARLTATAGPVTASMTAEGACDGVESLKRQVVLYAALPRIDFVQDVLKSPSGMGVVRDYTEEGYFVFPLKVPNFLLRHEMPTGNVRPLVDPNAGDPEQLPTTCTDHFTVNRWVDVSNQADFGATLVPVDVPLIMYGRRTPRHFNPAYRTAKPWLYSYAFNNLWYTNFQKTQPGRVVFRYSLRPRGGSDWRAGGAHRFGAEVCSPLRTSVILGRQEGSAPLKATTGQFVTLNQPNVVLTAAKLAEANGQGIVLRFNETEGRKTEVSVDLSLMNPTGVVRTDLVENDRGPLTVRNGSVGFVIDGYSWTTLRVLGGQNPSAITGLTAVTTTGGTQVAWTDQPEASQFEVFRGNSPDFTPASGTYRATVSVNHFYDRQVRGALTGSYYYRVRSVRGGGKGPFSAPAKASAGEVVDTVPPTAPVAAAQALRYDKITLSWEPSADNVALKGYVVYRDDRKVAELEPFYLSWCDYDTAAGSTYRYAVRALDESGNLSAAGKEVCVSTETFKVPDPAWPSHPSKKLPPARDGIRPSAGLTGKAP